MPLQIAPATSTLRLVKISNSIDWITGAVMVGYATLSMVTALFFQMDMRGTEVTPLGSLHPSMIAVMSLCVLLSIGFGAFLFGRRFRIYSFTAIVVFLFLRSDSLAGSPTCRGATHTIDGVHGAHQYLRYHALVRTAFSCSPADGSGTTATLQKR